MRYQVPQFIEIEDKIFGPLTLNQFIYMAGGAGISFVIYVFLNNIMLALIPIAAVMGISSALAFFKMNNRPLVAVVESAFHYFVGNKLYIWKKVDPVPAQTTAAAAEDARKYASIMVPKISDSKLKDLSWSLDVQEKMSARAASNFNK